MARAPGSISSATKKDTMTFLFYINQPQRGLGFSKREKKEAKIPHALKVVPAHIQKETVLP